MENNPLFTSFDSVIFQAIICDDLQVHDNRKIAQKPTKITNNL